MPASLPCTCTARPEQAYRTLERSMFLSVANLYSRMTHERGAPHTCRAHAHVQCTCSVYALARRSSTPSSGPKR